MNAKETYLWNTAQELIERSIEETLEGNIELGKSLSVEAKKILDQLGDYCNAIGEQ